MRAAVGMAALAAALAGCDSGPGKIAVGETKGKVLVAGKPLTAGTVAFYPADGSDREITGVGPDGAFAVRLVAGKYGVQIDLPTGKAASVPKKYQSHKTSGIEVDIPAGGKQLDDFDLK